MFRIRRVGTHGASGTRPKVDVSAAARLYRAASVWTAG